MSRRSRRGRARGTGEQGSERLCVKDMTAESLCVRGREKERKKNQRGRKRCSELSEH